MDPVLVRFADPSDVVDVARLSAELGYPEPSDRIAKLIDVCADDPFRRILVAEVEGRILGWIECLVFETLTASPEALITGLIVDPASRGQGIGKRLVQAVEDWAKRHQLSAIRVRSQVKRAEAHRFYESLGYETVKTQLVFRKGLS